MKTVKFVEGWLLLVALAIGALVAAETKSDAFRFAIIGDRTGETVPGVYEECWREAAAEQPDFVLTVGDTIQGGNENTAGTEWRQVWQILAPYKALKIFFTPGNHDVWSPASAVAYEKYTKRSLHYSFDYEQAHFVVLDNSRSDALPAGEMDFLRRDLELHRTQPLKFVISHRPSWILPVMLDDPQFPLHLLCKKYGVQFVIAGHVHEMLSFELEGVRYLSMASSGGHLRASKQYEDGWFFGHTLAVVKGQRVDLQIKELNAPFGRGRITRPDDWNSAGLTQ